MRLAYWFQVTPLQVVFMALAAAAIWLVNMPSPAHRVLGCMAGLATQPYWFFIAWQTRNGAVLVASILYTGAWFYGGVLAWRAL